MLSGYSKKYSKMTRLVGIQRSMHNGNDYGGLPRLEKKQGFKVNWVASWKKKSPCGSYSLVLSG